MSANLCETRRRFKSRRFDVSHPVIDRRKWREPIHCLPRPPVTNDEETNFIKRAVMWMAILCVTPLILFHIVTFIYPDLFWIPIAPN